MHAIWKGFFARAGLFGFLPVTDLKSLPRLIANGGSQNHEHSLSWGSLVEPLGIATFVLLACTLTLGLLMKKNRRVLLPLHRALAFITLTSAICHALLVLFAH